MSSVEERRAVAERLRGVTEEEYGLKFLEEILDGCITGCRDDDGEVSDWLIVRRLADLIDPVGNETTFALDDKSKDGEEVYPTRWWRCARCGEEAIMMYDDGKPVACPYCGAVANDDDD